MTRRTTAARLATHLGPALIGVALVAGCGAGSASSGGGDPTATTTPGPTSSQTVAPVRSTVVTLLSRTAGGGQVSTTAVPVPDAAAARAFAARFASTDLAAEVVGAVDTARVPSGESLYAAVVGVGCTPPQHIEVGRSDGGFTIESTDEPSPGIECYAAVTTVAIVLIAS